MAHLTPRTNDRRLATPAEFLSFVMAYSELLVARWGAEDLRLPAHAAGVPHARFRERGIPDAVLLWMMYQAQSRTCFQLTAMPKAGPPCGRPPPYTWGRPATYP
jgi:hypothetical protein